jgi:hypothetical protein
MVLLYVDDLIITGNNSDSIALLKKNLQLQFPIWAFEVFPWN